MTRNLPPMPPRIAKLPMDRGLPVIYVTQHDDDGTRFDTDPLLPQGWVAMMNDHNQGPPRRPRFGRVNPERQRRAVLLGLCGVCGEVLGRKRFYVSGDWGDKEAAALTEPPVCLPCLRWSLQVCPKLLTGMADERLLVIEDPDNTMELALQFHTLDDPNDPNTGVSMHLRAWAAPPVLGAAVTFVRMLLHREQVIRRPASAYL